MPKYQFNQLKLSIDSTDEKVIKKLSRSLKIPPGKILNLEILRKSLDGRKGKPKQWSYNVSFDLERSFKHPQLIPLKNDSEENEEKLFLGKEVHIVGAGPCGMAAALVLARKGIKVNLYEQGKAVKERFRDIRHFLKQGKLNPHSNVLYGEGGAGAFSDGKLTCRTRNQYTKQVLKDWVLAGADPSIEFLSKPHIGTDKLQFIVTKTRQMIEEHGGVVHFDSKLEDIKVVDKSVKAFKINDKWIQTDHLIMATGHSARSVYSLLYDIGVKLEHKPFAVGFRVEHSQELINKQQLGEAVNSKQVGAASYSLSAPVCTTGPGAYSFCMCPGGVLIPCAGEPGELATNGMSYSRRSGQFANAGIVVPVDLSADLNPLSGLDFQLKLERMAYDIGGGGFTAPAQRLSSFMAGIEDKELPKSSYPSGLVPYDHNDFFVDPYLSSLKESLTYFNKIIPGFIDTGLLVSPETRTSSPIRIPRTDDSLESITIKGLYPLGEGAGYAGGIISSAADGVKFASIVKSRA